MERTKKIKKRVRDVAHSMFTPDMKTVEIVEDLKEKTNDATCSIDSSEEIAVKKNNQASAGTGDQMSFLQYMSRSDLARIAGRVVRVFAISAGAKLALKFALLKLNILKLLKRKNIESVGRFGFASAAISATFLLLRWCLNWLGHVLAIK